jgi:hypothetical protein
MTKKLLLPKERKFALAGIRRFIEGYCVDGENISTNDLIKQIVNGESGMMGNCTLGTMWISEELAEEAKATGKTKKEIVIQRMRDANMEFAALLPSVTRFLVKLPAISQSFVDPISLTEDVKYIMQKYDRKDLQRIMQTCDSKDLQRVMQTYDRKDVTKYSLLSQYLWKVCLRRFKDNSVAQSLLEELLKMCQFDDAECAEWHKRFEICAQIKNSD